MADGVVMAEHVLDAAEDWWNACRDPRVDSVTVAGKLALLGALVGRYQASDEHKGEDT